MRDTESFPNANIFGDNVWNAVNDCMCHIKHLLAKTDKAIAIECASEVFAPSKDKLFSFERDCGHKIPVIYSYSVAYIVIRQLRGLGYFVNFSTDTITISKVPSWRDLFGECSTNIVYPEE